MFDDVPFQYSSSLVTWLLIQSNITTSSSALTTFTQAIDYSLQAGGRTFNSFQDPLTSNKIVIYISSLTMTANTTAPIKIDLSYSIINSTFYSWTTNLFQYGTITTFHVCAIIYNEDSILSSNQFYAINLNWPSYGTLTSQTF